MADEQSRSVIPDREWKTIVKNVPIVSVDLIVLVDGGIVLGKRKNKPAKGEWFVPGGTVFKNERRKEAVHRVAQEELNTDVTIERRMGTYEHFYRTAEVGTADGKHYLATAYVVTPHQDQLNPDDQHTELRRFSSPFPEFHPYVDRYLDELGLLERHPAPVEHATGNTR